VRAPDIGGENIDIASRSDIIIWRPIPLFIVPRLIANEIRLSPLVPVTTHRSQANEEFKEISEENSHFLPSMNFYFILLRTLPFIYLRDCTAIRRIDNIDDSKVKRKYSSHFRSTYTEYCLIPTLRVTRTSEGFLSLRSTPTTKPPTCCHH